MLINNEFSIQRYEGKSPLTLLTSPVGLDSIIQQQYNNFINNIVTIYGAQNSNGSVPVFFKTAGGSPSSSSTLTQLEGGQEYYFISKASASFPYPIPAIGGPLVSECDVLDPCCPSIKFVNSPVILSGPPESLYAYISANISGLVPGEEYIYTYESVSANWPSKISPLSGTLIANSYSSTINSIFSFCPTSGNCSGYFPCVLDSQANKEYAQKNIFSTLKIKISPTDNTSDCPVMSDDITIKCNKCLPGGYSYRPLVSIDGGPKLSLTAPCCANPIPLNITVTNGQPGKNYSFDIQAWPSSVIVNPSSGNASFGTGSGKIATMVRTNGSNTNIIKFSFYDDTTNENFVDFVSIVCDTSC